jgi:hypothetical protein
MAWVWAGVATGAAAGLAALQQLQAERHTAAEAADEKAAKQQEAKMSIKTQRCT